MSKKVGLWIDHREAIVVAITEEREEIKQIVSEAEKQPWQNSAPLEGSYESRQVPPDDRSHNIFMHQLTAYYDAVIGCIHGAESVLIFGADESKEELKKLLERDNYGDRIVDILTVDKMTDRQIADEIRDYFGVAGHSV